jgi:hypothetical protein
LKSENPNLKSTEITSELGRLWNELKSDESRSAELAIYEKQATDDKNRYDAEKVDDHKTSSKKDTSKKESSKKESSKKEAPKKEAPKKGKKAAQVDDVDVEDEAVTKSGKSKEPSVKKVNGYQKFCETRRPELKESYSNEKPADITKRMANEWKSLSKDEQSKWS